VKPLNIVIGFIPQAIFAVLVNWLALGWAAAAGCAAAIILVAVTATRGGVKILPIAQTVILAVLTVIGFTAGHHDAAAFAPYARGVASLVLGAFIFATSRVLPFTAQFARASVPQQFWHSPEFLGINRRLSLVWGLAVLAVGAAHLGAAAAGNSALIVHFVLDWAIPLYAIYQAYAITKRTVAKGSGAQHPTVSQPASPQI
jgi:hypothetical protein